MLKHYARIVNTSASPWTRTSGNSPVTTLRSKPTRPPHAQHALARRASRRSKRVTDIEPPKAPLKPFLLIGSPTLEGIHRHYSTGMPSLGLFNDDSGEFLGGHGMGAEHKTKTAAGLSRLWDSGEYDRVRSGDGAEKHRGKRLAMHLMAQPTIAETVLGDEILCGHPQMTRRKRYSPILANHLLVPCTSSCQLASPRLSPM